MSAAVEVPTCPECGGPAEIAEVGVLRETWPGDLYPELKPSPAGARYRCAGDHWFTEDGVPAGPPEDIEIKHPWPR